MRSHVLLPGCVAAATLALFVGCRDKAEPNAPDASPSATPAPHASAKDPFEGRRAFIELDVSSGGAPEHVTLSGERIGRIDPNEKFVPFTLSQSNDQPPNHPARWTFSLQTRTPPLPGQPIGSQGHLRYKGVIYSDVTPCRLTITDQGPAEGPNHARWVVGTFACDKMSSGGDAGAIVSVTNGRFEGPFVDTSS